VEQSIATLQYNNTPIRTLLDERIPQTSGGDDDFFVYVMGPYTAFDIKYAFSLDDEESPDIEEDQRYVDDPLFDPAVHTGDGINRSPYEAALADLCDHVRNECGVRPFVATDVEIPTPSRAPKLSNPGMTPLSQSLYFAAASDAVIFVYSQAALNAGVGTEMGTILSEFNLRLSSSRSPYKPRQRVKIFHTPYFSSATVNEIYADYVIDQLEFSTSSQIINQIEAFLMNIKQIEKTRGLPVWQGPDSL
jgi:hypothetical protein